VKKQVDQQNSVAGWALCVTYEGVHNHEPLAEKSPARKRRRRTVPEAVKEEVKAEQEEQPSQESVPTKSEPKSEPQSPPARRTRSRRTSANNPSSHSSKSSSTKHEGGSFSTWTVESHQSTSSYQSQKTNNTKQEWYTTSSSNFSGGEGKDNSNSSSGCSSYYHLDGGYYSTDSVVKQEFIVRTEKDEFTFDRTPPRGAIVTHGVGGIAIAAPAPIIQPRPSTEFQSPMSLSPATSPPADSYASSQSQAVPAMATAALGMVSNSTLDVVARNARDCSVAVPHQLPHQDVSTTAPIAPWGTTGRLTDLLATTGDDLNVLGTASTLSDTSMFDDPQYNLFPAEFSNLHCSTTEYEQAPSSYNGHPSGLL
jgi:hypothetical protein